MTKVFIDGQAGTTGLQISDRLATRADIDVIAIDPESRKHPDARRAMFEACDVAILCLPDDAAREAVALAEQHCRLLDASTAHRVAPGWIYGLPELGTTQRNAIAAADRVSNPGCYPQGVVLLIRPLIDAGLLSAEQAFSVHALSGYSGGGKPLIGTREGFSGDEREQRNTEAYALTLQHKHVPEMTHYSGTVNAPLFSPSVGQFYQGMLVQIPLFVKDLAPGTNPELIRETLADRYAKERFVEVVELGAPTQLQDGFLNATACNHGNRLQIMVFGHAEQVLLVARYDNLGKGAAGAAVQNLNLMIGCDEATSLS